MAIRFHCRRCNQLLAIGSRKAGQEINCPRCGETQGVPVPGTNDAEPPLAHASPAAIESMVVSTWLQDAPPAPPIVVPPEPLPNLSEETSTATPIPSFEAPEPMELPAAMRPADPPPTFMSMADVPGVPPGMVLLRRRTMHLQAVLFLVLVAATFALGYYVGAQSHSITFSLGPSAAIAAAEPALVEGQLIYENLQGQSRGDVGAVVIALPEGRMPKAPLPLAALAPGGAPTVTPQQQKDIEQIRALGGAYARVQDKGQFTLLVRPGSYRILFISANARRAKGTDIDEADSGEMRRYLLAPETLIGLRKYAWGLHTLGPGLPPPNRDFGRDGAQ
jgi:phage FluMu protein Com